MTEITLLDGGMSRELERCGAQLRQPEWSALALLETPDTVRMAHEAFISAGSEVITTNSYALVPFHLGEARFKKNGKELAELSGQLAATAIRTRNAEVRIAGSLPPACGSYVPETFDSDAAQRTLAVLIDGLAPYVDIWLAETMSSLTEARVTAEAVLTSSAAPRPLWIAYTLRDDVGRDAGNQPRLRSQETVQEAVDLALDVGAAAVLFNCSKPEVMAPAITVAAENMAARQKFIPIGVYANALFSQDEDGAANEVISTVRDDLTPDTYTHWADVWVAAGATLVGGCCGVMSPHIAALRQHFS